LEATLERLTNDYQKAIEEKMRCQREADETTKTIHLANSNNPQKFPTNFGALRIVFSIKHS
jgi:hypothetical protein